LSVHETTWTLASGSYLNLVVYVAARSVIELRVLDLGGELCHHELLDRQDDRFLGGEGEGFVLVRVGRGEEGARGGGREAWLDRADDVVDYGRRVLLVLLV
jgi:hypothetical protein